MSKYERLIVMLRCNHRVLTAEAIRSIHAEAADTLEAQAHEIEGLQAQLAATAKSAFEAMPHDIPRRMKRKICVETGWSMSMVSRAYMEFRAAFTGEAYKANEDIDKALLDIEGLRKEVDALSQDAACFRFWVREAAQSPCDMAKLIMRCVTEQDYRDVIMPIALAADKAIDAAKGESREN